jgi:hypothetical protein
LLTHAASKNIISHQQTVLYFNHSISYNKKKWKPKMTQTFLSIALSLLFGWGCAYYARRRRRDPKLWFFAGALFGILAFITLFILPIPLPKNNAPKGLAPPKFPQLAALAPLHADKLWYYLDTEKKQYGPMSFHALGTAWKEGSVREQTFVWNEEMENWQYFKEVIEIQNT